MVTHCNLARLRFSDGSVGSLSESRTRGELLLRGDHYWWRFWWRNEGKEAPWRLSFDSAPSALF